MILKLRYYGDPILREKCAPIEKLTPEILQLAQNLIDSVLHYDGAGLAAPQIGYTVRIFVIRYSDQIDANGIPLLCPPEVFINPVLSSPSTERDTQLEGCLSIPEILVPIERPISIKVERLDIHGEHQKEIAHGWRARAIMHENDHLNGILSPNRATGKVKKQLKPALKKLEQHYASPKIN